MSSPFLKARTDMYAGSPRRPLQQFVRRHAIELQKILTVALFYLVGVLYFKSAEGWSTSDCIYFITVSITTVGYGDYAPTKNNSKLFTIFFVLFGLLVIFSIISDFALYVVRSAEAKAVAKLKKKDPSDASKEPHTARIVISVAMILVCVFGGAIFFSINEDWSFLDGFYYSFITTMTVGYGDLTIEKDSSRIFSIFYIILSVVTVAGALGNIGAVQVAIAVEQKRNAMLTKKLDMAAIMAMDTDGGGVDRVEFLTAMLVQMNDLDKEKDIDPWLKRFDELDADGSGTLDEEDLRLFEEQEKERTESLKKSLGVLDDEEEEERHEDDSLMDDVVKSDSASSAKEGNHPRPATSSSAAGNGKAKPGSGSGSVRKSGSSNNLRDDLLASDVF